MNNSLNYDSPEAISQFLDQLNISTQKRFGQNFLINPGARKKIIQLLDLHASDEVWEIGPGLGAMTHMLMSMNVAVRVFEIDRAYQTILQQFFGDSQQFQLIAGDVLKTYGQTISQRPIKILGNLPYNISVAIINQLSIQPISVAVLTVQKEMAERLQAKPRSKAYSSLSVWTQAHYHCYIHGVLKPGSFYPIPRVDSTIIRLIPKPALPPAHKRMLDLICHSAFASRRKTLKNNWQAAQNMAEFPSWDKLELSCQTCGINLAQRAEEIKVDTYVDLAALLAE